MSKQKGVSLSTLRQLNVRNTLELLRERSVCSRAELTKLCGVSAPTMSKLLDNLLSAGLIEEEFQAPEGKGRPSKVYRVAADKAKVIGIVIGIDTCDMFTAGVDGVITSGSLRTFSTPETYDDLQEIMVLYIREYTRDKQIDYKGIGVCVPGLIDQQNQMVELSPNLHFLNGTTPGKDITKSCNLPTVLIHEEHALCLAEKFSGNAKNDDDFAVVDISAGIGTGIYSGGKYLSGQHGFAGEIGHVTVDLHGALCGCGNKGCLETVAGDAALLKAVTSKTDHVLTMDQLIDQVSKGELNIEKELDKTLDYLSVGVAMIINILNPSKVFIFGRMFEINDTIFSDLQERISKRALAPSVGQCTISRTAVNRKTGTIVGVSNHIFESVGPTIMT